MPEEQDVHADHDSYHREDVKRGGYPVSHRLILVCTMLAHVAAGGVQVSHWMSLVPV